MIHKSINNHFLNQSCDFNQLTIKRHKGKKKNETAGQQFVLVNTYNIADCAYV